MNITTRLQRSVQKTGFIFKGVMVAIFLLTTVLGIQSANAAINTELDLNDTGLEVSKLQTFLSGNVNIYPEQLVTGYYGQFTKAAVERFQTAKGIVSQGTPLSTGYGRVGPATLASINGTYPGAIANPWDKNAPIISDVNVNPDTDSASVSWKTAIVSMGKVYYSTSPITISNTFDITGIFSGEPTVSGTLANYDAISSITHTVHINNLSRNTRYYYLIVSFDASKNVSITTPNSFVTD